MTGLALSGSTKGCSFGGGRATYLEKSLPGGGGGLPLPAHTTESGFAYPAGSFIPLPGRMYLPGWVCLPG